MRTRSRFAIVLVLLAASAAPAGEASAHYQIDKHRWWFGGNTYAEETSDDKVDPVNMLFYPGFMTRTEVDEHFNDHIGEPDREPNEWFEHHNLPEGVGPASCRGDQWVKFRRVGPTSDPWDHVPTDFHGAMVEHGEGRCANRYHIRFWGDATHEQMSATTHSRDQAWIVGGAHYEEVLTERVGHAPAMDWDVVEQRVVQFMRPHSYSLRWKCLPHSYGVYQDRHSDGRITRLSANHGRGSSTTATRDNGQC